MQWLKNNIYLWGEIVRGNCLMKEEVPTFSHFLFWYIILIIGIMKEIKLTRGLTTLVDDEDFNFLMQWKWHALKDKNTYYVKNKNQGLMHRLIMHTPRELEVDHIDHNGLNNQKDNLRNCLHRQNSANRRQVGKSGKMGVVLHHTTQYWNNKPHHYIVIRAQIKINGKMKTIGNFKTIEDAARAYDKFAEKYHGEFANLNFKD